MTTGHHLDNFSYLRFSMPKKVISLLFIVTAYTFIIGHCIISHHHHDSTKELTEHHQTNHHHSSDEDSGDLSHLFSHFIHAADGFTTLNYHSISNTLSKQPLLIVAVLTEDFSLYNDVGVSPLLNRPPAEHLIYSSPHSLASGLRAPPAFIA